MGDKWKCDKCGKEYGNDVDPFITMEGDKGNTSDGMLFICKGCVDKDFNSVSVKERKTAPDGCPFCGEDPSIELTDCEGREVEGPNADFVRIVCSNCNVTMEDAYVDMRSVYDIVARWNERIGDEE